MIWRIRSLISKGLFVSTMAMVVSCSIDSQIRGLDSHEVSLRAYQTPVEAQVLRPGDQITVSFMLELSPRGSREYKIESGDKIRLYVRDREDLQGVYPIGPDGALALPVGVSIHVLGTTLSGLKDSLERVLRPFVPGAVIQPALEEFNGKALAFIQTLAQNSAQGPSFNAVVDVDGRSAFPQIGRVYVQGLSLAQLNDTLAKLYAPVVPEIDVTARLTGGAGVVVLGEVRSPGVYSAPGGSSLAEAIGRAQGWLPSAHLDNVILLQIRGNSIHVRKVDLQKDMLFASTVVLVGGDVVLVPKDAIGDLNSFVDRYIRRNIPINLGINGQWDLRK